MVEKKFTITDIEPLYRCIGWGKEAYYISLLLNTVPNSYQPREKVLAMAVGCGSSKLEGSIIREFHQIMYGLNKDSVIVIGCDILDFAHRDFKDSSPKIGLYEQKMSNGKWVNKIVTESRIYYSESGYDLQVMGASGDASTILPWFLGLRHAGNTAYDYIHLFNPDFVDLGGTTVIYKNALELLTQNGIIVTISQGLDDSNKLLTLCETLEKEGDFVVGPITNFEYESIHTISSNLYSISTIQKEKRSKGLNFSKI